MNRRDSLKQMGMFGAGAFMIPTQGIAFDGMGIYDLSKMAIGTPERLDFFRKNKFGMFMHFGVYAVTEGRWKGEITPGMTEWILKKANIPIQEYKALAKKFNPENFDAKKVVDLAKRAGMKWIVFTVRHHDCFAMFETKTNDWNIVDATPYGKDLFKELADECHNEGIKVGCQFTIGRNWTDPKIGDKDWSRAEGGKAYWDAFYQREVKGQIRELLTNYGDIGIMWFDSPVAELSQEITDLVHELQPKCLVNGRVGGAGEYGSTFDSTIRSVPSEGFWECCSTIGESWAYRRKDDMRYSSARALTQYMVDIGAKNGMNLLNVGPLPDGSINPEEESRLIEVGQWMDENKQFFHGTEQNPYQVSFDFGTILIKENKILLHFFGWPKEKFTLYGLENEVEKAYIGKNGKDVKFVQNKVSMTGLSRLQLDLPTTAPDEIDSVVVLEIKGDVKVAAGTVPQSDGGVVLEPALAEITNEKRGGATVESRSDGRLIRWKEQNQKLIWKEVYFAEAGSYQATFLTSGKTYRREGQLPEKVDFVLGLIEERNNEKEFSISFNQEQKKGIFPVGNKGHIPVDEHLRIGMHTADFYPSGKIEIPKAGLYRIQLALADVISAPMRFRQLRLNQI